MMAVTALLHPDRLDSAVDLLSAAAESLANAHWARTVHGRGAGTKLAVLRAGAAVLSVRGRSATSARSTGPLDVWRLLPRVAPELTEWAEFFGAVFDEERGGPLSVREVDDLLRQGEEFVQIVAGLLGLPPVPVAGELASLVAPGGHG